MVQGDGLDPYMSDCYAFIQERLGTGPWIPLYQKRIIPGSNDDFFLFSAIVPADSIDELMSTHEWEIMLDSFRPGFDFDYSTDPPNVVYQRYGRDDGIEPILIYRFIPGKNDKYFDVSEEFRLLYNLYHDRYEGKYIRILDDGNEEDIVRCSADEIIVNARILKEFLAIKQAILILYINVYRLIPGKFSELDDENNRFERRSEDVTCEIAISDDPRGRRDEIIFSSLLGKKKITGSDAFDPHTFRPGEAQGDEFLEFIIGIDEAGDDISFTCDERQLANFFGKNKGNPNYVTPVFFRREVLGKYYADPDKYSVNDGNLFCEGLWSLRMDNNHDKYVIVLLGDLGHLSTSEQRYWRSFNVKPDGSFSEVGFRRGFLAEFADPSMADLKFKQSFELFQEAWQKKFSWNLFLPLSEEDSHYYKKIRVPLRENQAEFDELVLAITKVIIDSLNEERIAEQITSEKITGDRGISKLNRFLAETGATDYEDHIRFLRKLQNLKSAAASHRKGTEYDKIAREWGVGRKSYKNIYIEILSGSIKFLDYLRITFLI